MRACARASFFCAFLLRYVLVPGESRNPEQDGRAWQQQNHSPPPERLHRKGGIDHKKPREEMPGGTRSGIKRR